MWWRAFISDVSYSQSGLYLNVEICCELLCKELRICSMVSWQITEYKGGMFGRKAAT
jgi:hypothetical protein